MERLQDRRLALMLDAIL